MLPIEAAALIGSLAGIAEIAKETFFGEEAPRARERVRRTRAAGRRRRHDDPRLHPRSSAPGPGGSSALILLALEIVAPGNVFVWFGIAAILTGGVALRHRLSWQTELILFVVLALILVIVGRRAFSRGAARASSRSSTSGPHARSARRMCSASRSSTATAASGSTTPTGGSPAPICRRDAGQGVGRRRGAEGAGGWQVVAPPT